MFAHRSDLDTTVACYFGFSSRPLYVFYVPFQPIDPAPASHFRPCCVWTGVFPSMDLPRFRPWTFRAAKRACRCVIYAFADKQPTLSRFWVAFCFRIAGTNRSGIAFHPSSGRTPKTHDHSTSLAHKDRDGEQITGQRPWPGSIVI